MPSVTPSPYNSGDTPSELEPMKYVFGPTGSGRPHVIDMDTVYDTPVRRSVLDSEQRTVMLGRPYRRVPVVATGFGAHQQVELRAMASRMTNRRFQIPIHQDRSALTSPAPATTVNLVCSTDYRRFFDGGRALLFKNAAGRITSFEVVDIVTVNAGSLTISGGVVGDFAVGDFVAPVIECDLLPDVSVTAEWFRNSSMNLLGVETTGPSALPGIEDVGSQPSGFTIHSGYPILDIDAYRVKDGREGSAARYALVTSTGRGNIPAVFGTRARMAEVCPLEFPSRAAAWDYIRFFDSRGGSAHPYWMLSPTMEYLVTAATLTSITVPAIGEESDWMAYRPTIGILLDNGVTSIRSITGVSRSSGEDTLTFSTVAQLSVDKLVRAAPAFLFKMSDDVLSERWLSEELMRTEIRAVELTRDVSMTIANFARETATVLSSGYAVGDCAVPPEFVCPFTEFEPGSTFDSSQEGDDWLSECGGGLSASANRKPVADVGSAKFFQQKQTPTIRSYGQKHHFKIGERGYTFTGADIETLTWTFTVFYKNKLGSGCDNEGDMTISLSIAGPDGKQVCAQFCPWDLDNLAGESETITIALKRDPGNTDRFIIDTANTSFGGSGTTDTGWSFGASIPATTGQEYIHEDDIVLDVWRVYSGETGSCQGCSSTYTQELGFRGMEICPVLFSGSP